MISIDLAGFGQWARFRSGILAAVLAVVALASTSHAATVSIAAESFVFTGDTVIDVPIRLENATGAAGVDFVLEYDLADFAGGATTTDSDGGLLSLLQINHDFSTDLVAGTRQIKVAAASATGLNVSSGVLLTLHLPVTCAGYAQGFPGGRTVTLRISAVHVFDETGTALTADSLDGQLALKCTTVANDASQSMSTIKFLYRN